MKELPIDRSSPIDGVSCSNCVFKHEAAELYGTGKMLCAEPPWQNLTTYNSYCGHWISKKTGEEFRVLIIRDILLRNNEN